MVLSVLHNSLESIARLGIQKSTAGLARTLERLATGKKINSPKDNPADFIACSLIRSDITAAQATLKANQKEGSKLSVVESGLAQIGSLLNQAKGLVLASANTGALSQDQIDAYQMQLDGTIASIRRITNTTTFQGERVLSGLEGLLNGTLSEEQSKTLLGTPKFGLNGKRVETATVTRATSIPCNQSGQTTIGDFAEELVQSLETVATIQKKAALGDSVQSLNSQVLANVPTPAASANSSVDLEDAVDSRILERFAEADPVAVEAEQIDVDPTETETEPIASEPIFEQGADEAATSQTVDPEVTRKEQAAQKKAWEAKLRQYEEESNRDYFLRNKDTAEIVLVQDVIEEKSLREQTLEEVQSLLDSPSHQSFLSSVSGTRSVANADETMFLLKSGLTTGANSFAETKAVSDDDLRLATANADESGETPCCGEEAEEESSLEGEPEKTRPRSIDALNTGSSADLRSDPEAAGELIDSLMSAFSFARTVNGIQQKSLDVDNALLTDSIFYNSELDALLSDTDYAEEASNLARYQLLMQSGFAVLKIARELPKMLLDLILK